MSPEEVERTVQFLLQQQAQFAADMARFAAEAEARSAALDARLTAKTERLADGLIGLTSIVGQLAATQQGTEQSIRELDTKFAELGDYIKSVESHLDVVIQMFERHLRDDHGHQPS